MDRRAYILDIGGKLLLCWFVFEGIHFLATGKFLELAGMLPQFFRNRIDIGLSVLLRLVISTFGVLAAVPLLLKGRTEGLVLGVAIRLSGHTVNPLSLILPAGALTRPDLSPTLFGHAVDILWFISSLLVLIFFFLQRRATHRA